MPLSLPGPVLAVAADVVRQLEGEEALPLLWILFTKCKESLRDGRRLENISWRLWYKSMAETGFAPGHGLLVETLVTKETVLDEKNYRPPTPEEIPQPPPVIADTTSNVPLSTTSQGASNPVNSSPLLGQHENSVSLSPSPSLSPSLSWKPSSRRNSQRRGSSVSVGKILCELLPAATIPSLSPLSSVPSAAPTLSNIIFSPPQPGDPRTLPSISLPLSSPLSHLTAHLPAMTVSTKEEQPPTASLPTPEVEHVERDCSLATALSTDSSSDVPFTTIVPVVTTSDNDPSPLKNPNQTVPDNHDNSLALPPPPRLVVVHPTPNPTPHPTPPATPVLQPPGGHMKQNGEASLTHAVPLLHVPGHDALVQAQVRARTIQMSSRLRLSAHESQEEEADTISPVEIVQAPATEAASRSEAPSALIPAHASGSSECRHPPVNPNRHSISSDTTTTSSSSQHSSSSTTSDYSKTTSATTVSEFPLLSTLFEKHRSSSTSSTASLSSPAPQNQQQERPCPAEANLANTDLSPTCPAYATESVDVQASASTSSLSYQRRDDKDNVPFSESPSEMISALPRTSKITAVDSTSVTSPSSRGQSATSKPARKVLSSNGVSGMAGQNRSRVKREGSTTSTKSIGLGKSRSRSRSQMREGGSNSALNPTGLVMTRVASNTNVGKGGGGERKVMASRGRTVGANRTRGKVVSRKQNTNGPMMKETVEGIVGRGMLMFNIGSGSDVGSKSTGSGSEMNGNNGNRKEESVSAVEEEPLTPSMESRQMEGEDELDSAHMKDGTPIAPVIPPVEKVQSPRRSQAKGKEKETVTFVEKEKPSKGKGKERVKSPATKSSTMLPRVEATIGDPLLPSKGRQVILDSDSEDFETETESYTGTESADVPLSESQQRLQFEREQQKQLQQQHAQQQRLRQQLREQHQQQQAQTQAPAQAQAQHPVRQLVSRVHSHQIARNAKQLSRAQMQQRLAEQRVEERKWKEEMFVKLPKSSFQNLTEIARTRSAGLLTQLLKPDLQLLPHDHPYRRGFSSGMIQPLRPFTPLAPAQPFPQQHQHQHQHSHPQVARPQPPSTPAPPPVQAPPVLQRSVTETPDQPTQHSRQPSRTYQLPKHMAALTNPGLVGAAAKTPVATAVMSELRVGSISGTKQTTTGGVSVNESADGNATAACGTLPHHTPAGGSSKYKPKTRPPETVMEDESDGESDDAENRLDLSKSVAQEKLKALLEAKKLKKSALVAQQEKQQQQLRS
ncbi:hypothetical protein AN958_08511 [Leucoagaricus sp. SymC.cos]|nr:hypothetical protein AN958_08511 [Leucoagaricus sp. SymC.cos]